MKIRTALAAAALSALLLAPITAAHADEPIVLPAIDELTAAERLVGDEPLAAYTKPGGGRDPVTFCHKPGTPASHEITTDDDGLLEGHLGHGDTIGVCPPVEQPTEEPTETPTEEPTETPTEEPTETPTEQPTEEPTVTPTTPAVTPPAAAVPTTAPTVTEIGTAVTPPPARTLAATGAGTAAGLATVVALLAVGTGALLLARRRRTATA